MAFDGINWEHLGQEQFDRVVENLLRTHHVQDPAVVAYAVAGRGGDEGLDVVVERDGHVEHVYQLKFFPGGFSSALGKVRRPQIKESFETAMSKHAPAHWTLVVPTNGTVTERRFVSGLRRGRQVAVHFMGRAELDGLMTEHPAVYRWATRNDLVDTLRAAAHEKDGLVGADDLADRVAALQRLADSRSENWGVQITSGPDGVSQAFYAKRPDAAEREPISIHMLTRFAPEHVELRARWQHAFDYGVIQPVHLPPEAVEELRVEGPEWVEKRVTGVSVDLLPEQFDPIPVSLRVEDREGRVRTALAGEARRRARGRVGSQIETVFRNSLNLVWTFDTNSTAGTVTATVEMDGVPAADALAALRFMEAMNQDGAVIRLAAGPTHISAENLTTTADRDQDAAKVLLSMAEDLAFLENHFGVTLPIPSTMPANVRLNIRMARMLVEGRCLIYPNVATWTGTLNGSIDDTIEDFLVTDHAILLTYDDFELEVLGERLFLGRVSAFHPRVTVPDGKAHVAALKAGRGEGRQIEAVPADDTAFRVYSPDTWLGEHRPLVPEPWGVAGIDEHPSLQRILDGPTPTA